MANYYREYLKKVLKKYFEDIVKSAYPKAKCKFKGTYWSSSTYLPFHIDGEIKINKKTYDAVLEFFSCKVKGYDTDYGAVVLALYNKENEDDCIWIYVNPLTLECSNQFNGTDKEENFWKNLAYWAENFESEKYKCPHDGKTGPELKDVIITYYNKQFEK